MEITAIKDIRGGMKNLNVIFIVLEVTASTKTKENRDVFSFKIADSSASMSASIWDEPGKLIAPGDIIRLTKAYASVWRGSLTLYSGKAGEVAKMGDFCMVFNESINMSEPILNQNTPATLPANSNGTNNGNGRAIVANSNPTVPASNQPNSNSTLPASTDVNKPKTNSNSRNYIRRPINKK